MSAADPLPNPGLRPNCSNPMLLTQINPGEPGYESRFFSCPKCEQTEIKVFNVRCRLTAYSAAPNDWALNS
jgi:hypothetical protein